MIGNSKPILLIDKDTASAEGIKRVFEDLKVTNPLVHYSDPDKALGYLQKEDEKSPWLIFLNLGKQDTKDMEFLKLLKSDRVLRLIPVVLVGGSRNQETIAQSFELGAVGYVVKPAERQQLMEMFRTIFHYWILCRCPSNGG